MSNTGQIQSPPKGKYLIRKNIYLILKKKKKSKLFVHLNMIS